MATRWVGNVGILTDLEAAPRRTAERIAADLKLSPHTVRHHLDRLRRWGQVRAAEEVEQLRVRQPRRGIETTLPVRTLRWSITRRGRARLAYLRKRDG